MEKMVTHLVKEGNAFYEIDEECAERQRQSRSGILKREKESLRLHSTESAHRQRAPLTGDAKRGSGIRVLRKPGGNGETL